MRNVKHKIDDLCCPMCFMLISDHHNNFNFSEWKTNFIEKSTDGKSIFAALKVNHNFNDRHK